LERIEEGEDPLTLILKRRELELILKKGEMTFRFV
jgi:hypothetical protein